MALAEQVRYFNDNGMMFWPPECELVPYGPDHPVAQAWLKYDDEKQHREILERRESVRCTTPLRRWRVAPTRAIVDEIDDDGMRVRFETGDVRRTIDVLCGAYLPSWRAAPLHQAEKHPGQACRFDFVHMAWTWELLGFPELYWGNPRGWYNLLDGADPSVKQWEQDALELGTTTADHWWNTPY